MWIQSRKRYWITRIPHEQTKELAALFRHLNVGLDNGSLYFPPLPSVSRIYRCIVSIEASRIKKSGLFQEKWLRQVWMTWPIAQGKVVTFCSWWWLGYKTSSVWPYLVTATHSHCKQAFALSDCQYHLSHFITNYPFFHCAGFGWDFLTSV